MTIAEFDRTLLARSLAEKYGWDITVWERLTRFAEDRRIAVKIAGNSPSRRGMRAADVECALLTEFGADTHLCIRYKRYAAGSISDWKPDTSPLTVLLGDLLYAANIIGDICGLGRAMSGMSIAEATADTTARADAN